MMRNVVWYRKYSLRLDVIVMGLPAEVLRAQPSCGRARGISNNFKVVSFDLVV